LTAASATASPDDSTAVTSQPFAGQHAGEQAHAAVEVDRPAPAGRRRSGRSRHQLGQGVGAVRAGLEERPGGDPPAPAGDQLVDVVAAHPGRNGDLGAARQRHRQPVPGPGAAAQDHLLGLAVAAVYQQLLEQRVDDQAARHRDRLVAAGSPVAGPAAGDGCPQARPVARRGQFDGAGGRGMGDPPGPAQRRRDRLLLQCPLAGEAHVLPLAASAAPGELRAGRHHAQGGRLEDLDRPGAEVGRALAEHGGDHPLAREGTAQEDRAPPVAGDRLAPSPDRRPVGLEHLGTPSHPHPPSRAAGGPRPA
jgi:hypothetical protein